MLDIWQEIWSTLRKNKLRTFLTGFSVAWGIFMLIILLGSGNGLKNGVQQNFGNRAKNSFYIWPGRMSVPYAGMQKGRRIKFLEADEKLLKESYQNISNLSLAIEQWNVTISYGAEYGTYTIKGINPEYKNIENIEIKPGNGRFINDADMHDKRKVIVIHQRTADILFKKSPPLGKYVTANKIMYQVVGVYSDDDNSVSPGVYIPLSTARIIYNPPWGYNSMEMTIEGLNSAEEGAGFETEIRQKLGRLHTFEPTDNQSIYIWNMLNNYLQTLGIFNGITLFIWIIGIGTLIAGIVGVSNIMLITVKERTHEFGIRKALGANPVSILKLVVIESVLITIFFGYLGMISGIGLTELVAHLLGDGGEMTIFKNPTVELPVALSATAVLIFSGILAGYFPARKAVNVKPIEALRNE